MSTVGYAYRQRLREFLEQGSFSKDPAREKLIRRHLDEWDKWAELSAHELKVLDASQKWFWCFIIPGVVMFLYAVLVLGRRTSQQYKKLEEAQEAFINYRAKHGASSVENEAISYVANAKEQ